MSLYADLAFNLPLNQIFSYSIPEGMKVHPGMRVKAPFGKRKLVGYVISTGQELSKEVIAGGFEVKDIISPVDQEAVFNDRLVDLARWMSRMYFSNLGECLAVMIPGANKEGEFPLTEGEEQVQGRILLNQEQEAAVDAIIAEAGGLHYLAGVTGSGKTEVFLQAAEACLGQGQGVIYLVPEIALTSQVQAEIRERFGANSALLHSRLTPKQRLAEWRRILEGRARIVVGARSAVFAPVSNLGLIILDEEHETAYKSQNAPRYHARQVAMWRARTEGARLVMGSATPSLEAYYLMQEGGLRAHRLKGRPAGGRLPQVKIVDLRKTESSLSPELILELETSKAMGRQSLLFLNRRGFAYFFHCRSCAADAKCKHCSASLTYHKSINQMVCHYCGYRCPPPRECPSCGSLDLAYSGFGTEQVEEELRHRFPDWNIKRLDTDAVQKKGILESTLEKFRRGEVDVLLGTQMIAKGFNFPGLRLVGLVMPDSGLHLPDFRSAERSFSLIMQVAGRAGRFGEEGLVLIQTYNPQNPVITLAAEGRLEEFYTMELENRRSLAFPPFTRLLRLVLRSRRPEKGWEYMEELGRRLERARQYVLESAGTGSIEILGPAEAPIGKIAGNYRIHVLLASPDFKLLHSLLTRALWNFDPPSGLHLEVDVDPASIS